MKKYFMTLLMGLFVMPLQMLADHYEFKKLTSPPGPPIMAPALYRISVYVDYETGDIAITPNYNITGLNITITGNGVTYLNTTVSLSAGQSYTDCLDYLPVGTYILTLSTADGVIDQYEITVEDDE
jgi:hypothetical protein